MSYPGGKAGAGVYQTLINLMPPHQVFVDLFMGGGALTRLKRPARVNIGIDSDRSALESVMMPAGSPLPLLSAGISRPGEARRRRSAVPLWGPKIADRLTYQADGVPIFELRWGDAFEFLRKVELPSDALVYADPPYLRSARRDTVRDRYTHEMTDRQHRELLSLLKKLKCMVMVSGYSSAIYAKELKGWHCTAFQAATRGRPAAEWVWCNYPRPEVLHDYRFLGNDFRERANLKRMISRWEGKLKKMTPVKRQALLAAIAATGGSGDATRSTNWMSASHP